MADLDRRGPLYLARPGDLSAESFADTIQGEVTCLLGAGDLFETYAWILATRHPFTKDPYLDSRLGLHVYNADTIGEDADRRAQLARVRELAEDGAAVGAAYVTRVYHQALDAGPVDPENLRPRPIDGVLLLIEHRALGRARRRIAREPGRGPAAPSTWIDLGELDLLVFAGGGPLVPPLLPPLT